MMNHFTLNKTYPWSLLFFANYMQLTPENLNNYFENLKFFSLRKIGRGHATSLNININV